MSKLTLALMGLTALSLGCKDKDCDSGGCDTGIDDTEPGEVDVSISWPSDDTLQVTISDDVSGTFAGILGLAETGAGNSGWYEEDCLAGEFCHSVVEGSNTFTSVHPDVGGDWAPGDAIAAGTTLMHGGLHSKITYAVWDAVTEDCVHVSGDDESYFADSGC